MTRLSLSVNRFKSYAVMTTFLLLVFLLGSSLSFADSNSNSIDGSKSLPDTVERILPSVVNISSVRVVTDHPFYQSPFLDYWGFPSERKQSSLGSGFIIDENGYVLTNTHVVEQANEVLVTLSNNNQYRAKLVGMDPKLDVALLQIINDKTSPIHHLLPVQFADSNKVRIAEAVVAIGNPFGLKHTVTVGIISAKNRTVGIGPFDNYLQTDASINPGNSGGPLFNFKGEVIGINTFIFSKTGQSGGLGFAIPINEALEVVPDLKKFGRVPRPWLGILGQQVTRSLQVYYDLPGNEGILIYRLVRGSPAHRNNLQAGDIIISVNGTKVFNPLDIEKTLLKSKPDALVSIDILRGSNKKTLKFKLKEMPKNIDRLPEGFI